MKQLLAYSFRSNGKGRGHDRKSKTVHAAEGYNHTLCGFKFKRARTWGGDDSEINCKRCIGVLSGQQERKKVSAVSVL